MHTNRPRKRSCLLLMAVMMGVGKVVWIEIVKSCVTGVVCREMMRGVTTSSSFDAL